MSTTIADVGIPAVILAHQGGWDEALLVVGPMVIIAALLWLARRRVDRRPAGDEPDPHVSTTGGR